MATALAVEKDKAPALAMEQGRELSALEALKAAPKVKIRIHKTGDRNEQTDVYVGVNGIGYQIRRGVDVEVPEPVAKVLEDATQTIYEFDEETQTRTLREAQAYPFTYLH